MLLRCSACSSLLVGPHVPIRALATELPAVVHDAVCDILYTAALSIRAAANAGDAKYCAIEANSEVPRHVEQLAQIPDSNADAYKKFWDALRMAAS